MWRGTLPRVLSIHTGTMELGLAKSLPLVAIFTVLLQFCPEGFSLELSPSEKEVILSTNSSFTVVCSGWSKVTWKSPHDPSLEGVAVEDRGTTSVLVLHNVTWRHSGNYVCEEPSTEEAKDISVFVPDPEEWFLPLQQAVVMKEGEEGTIPCVVTDPGINVTLYERASKASVEGTYHPSKGFTAILKDSSYICRGAMNGEEKASQVYYVYSIVGKALFPKSMNAFMTLSKTVLKQGEALMVNCTVEEAEMVYFEWDFPRKEVSSDLLFKCNFTERGFVDLEPSINTNVSALQYQSVALTVQIEAFPKPQVLWTRDNTTLTGETVSIDTREVHETSYLSTLTLVRVRMEQRGLYTVQVANEDDVKEITFDLQVNSFSVCASAALFSQVAVLAAVLALVVIAVIFLIILIALWRKKPRYEIRWKVIESVSSDGHKYTYMDPMHLPYDCVWEVPRDSLVLGHTLGSGAFGRVVEATAYGLGHSQSTTKVAVKMLKSTARTSETQALISELKIMSHLGPHLNIVNLLGACTKRGPIYLITEYCCYGDLVDYLHRNKHTFLQYYADKNRRDADMCRNSTESTVQIQGKSECDGGYMDMTKEDSLNYVPMQELSDNIKYADIEPSVNETPYHQDSNYQGQGTFLYTLSTGHTLCVHRDLAARNVLICEGKLVKICDFGLARDVMNDSNYIAKGKTFLPLKWMAPESIFQNLYTTLSDVWSFGILLSEIFTLGGTPYPGIPMNEQFYTALKRGYRMPKPAHATDEIYDIMCKCWDEKFKKRPLFSSLVNLTGNLLTDAYKKKYTQVNESFLKSDHHAAIRSKPIPAGNPAVKRSLFCLLSPPSTTDQADTASLDGPEAPLEEPVPTEEAVLAPTEEAVLAPTQEDKLPQSPCVPEVEESFL
uniref:receptor protein-tyrosine kinase n=1 Tax=Oncorhynchus tshawytscha TaxID=74940 RepID=A0A8C8FGV9_ONCTS